MKSDKVQLSGFNNIKSINFKGQRVLHNKVLQLSKNNAYSLSEPNRRAILNAINELGKVKGIKNIRFLMDTAARNKYSTNIILQDAPKIDWKGQLLDAAKKAVAETKFSFVQASYWLSAIAAIAGVKPLNNDENEILKLREQLLASIDTEQIQKETIGATRDFQRNLDYLITSSETTLKHKKYVLEKLNYLMSDEYEINPQLKDKKSIVAAEIVNDMAIAVPGNKIPNIKAVNQKQHGMCAAISIVRKKLAYENKPDYIDSILSELDNTPYIKVYDRSALGSGKKIDAAKIPVDFEAAIAKGYRIIDASTMQWMQLGNMTGFSNISYNIYNAFDKENFDVNTDSFFNARFEDKELEKAQIYYQALIKAEDVLQDYKASQIKQNVKKQSNYQNKNNNIQLLSKIKTQLKENLSEILPEIKREELNKLCAELVNLEKDFSDQIKGNEYAYIPNEEDIMKKDKIRKYIFKRTNIQVNEKDLDKIYDLIDYYNSVSKELNSLGRTKNYMLSKASRLYEIGAAFRYAILMSFEEKLTLEGLMKDEKIPHREALVQEAIEDIIVSLYQGSPNDEVIIKHLEKVSGIQFENKEQAIAALVDLRNNYERITTSYFDEIYNNLTFGNRKEVLSGFINQNIELINQGNEDVIQSFAKILNTPAKSEAVSKALKELDNALMNGDESQFKAVYNLVGNMSQAEDLFHYYTLILQLLQQENNGEIVANFLAANNLPIEDDPNIVLNKLAEIQNKINTADKFISQCEEIVKIKNDNGEVLFSADPKDKIIKKLENDGTISSYKGLKDLQKHLDAIKKDRSTDEFSSRQGKLKDKNLYNFSPFEKETLKTIERNIDPMYSFIQKEIKQLRSDLSENLEELKRIIGLNNGKYWVAQEGSSGLHNEQEIKILEYMTGRPHYSTNNVAEAIEKIKNSPYSGISGSSVFHNKVGMHAQYIADIAPVKVQVKDKDGNIKEEVKEVLFNDNSWGASEHENVWVDSMGLTRTDYSDNRGGTLGYITNEMYRNGNLVERINGDMLLRETPEYVNSKLYNKIKNTDGSIYTTPQYDSIILDGKAPNLKSIADALHDTIFIPAAKSIADLQMFASKMTEQEAISAIKKYELSKEGWEEKYASLKARIFEDGKFGKQINTKEDYDKLADDDYLKVVLEKIALKKNYQVAGREPDIAKVTNVKELTPIRKEQRRRAIEGFKYSFSKSKTILDYLANSITNEEFDNLIEIKNKYNLEINDDEFMNLIQSIALSNKARYDGSLATTLRLVAEQIDEDLAEGISNEAAREEMVNYLRNVLENKMYINEKDLNNNNIKHIINFIDREFDPADNEEFIKIYRRIQDMTNEEFKSEILPRVKREDLGIKTFTGYDILKKIQRYEEQAETDLMNNVYYDTLISNLDMENYTTSYTHNKLTRQAKYKQTVNFNTVYRDLIEDLDLLTYTKLFNQYKDSNIRKYGAYPAYPKVDYATDELFGNNFNAILSTLYNSVEMIKGIKNQKENYSIYHKLNRYARKLSDEAVLSDYQFKNINNLLGRFVTINYGDDSIQEAFDAAYNAMEIQKGAQFKEYRPFIEAIDNVLSDFERTTPAEKLDVVVNNNIQLINSTIRQFVLSHAQERYRAKLNQGLNSIVKAMINSDKDLEIIEAEVYNQFKQWHILHNPEELLQSYIKSCTKEDENGHASELKIINSNLQVLLSRATAYSTLARVQEIIMNAIRQGIAMDAKSLFHTLSIQMSNGDLMPMDSDEIIKTMTHTLILDNQTDTALMFLDKLGLNEQYVKYTANDIDFEELKEKVNESVNIVKNYGSFKQEFSPLSLAANDALTRGEDYNKVLNRLKRDISRLGKKYNIDKKAVKTWLNEFDNIKKILTEQPETEPWLLYKAKMAPTELESDSVINNSIEYLNNFIASAQTIIDTINAVPVTQGSDADMARIEMNEKYNELIKYIEDSKADLPAGE